MSAARGPGPGGSGGGAGAGSNGHTPSLATGDGSSEETPLLPVYRQYSSSEIFDAKHGPIIPSWDVVVQDARTILTLGLAVFVGTW